MSRCDTKTLWATLPPGQATRVTLDGRLAGQG
jgi:hypothetical protein